MQTLIIDIRPLLPKHLPGGVREYTREIVRGIFERIQINPLPLRVVLFSSGWQKPTLQFFEKYKRSFFHYHIKIYNQALNTSFRLFHFPEIDVVIKKRLKIPAKESVTVFAPNINLLPLSKKARLIAVFHDLSFERYPFFLHTKERLWHRLTAPQAIAKRADIIIAVSESTKEDLINLYEVNPHKIQVVYSGVSEEFTPRSAKHEARSANILYLGSLEGRKNIEALKRAFALVQKRLPRERLNLVAVGPPRHPVSSRERIALYQSASLFVYPSVFEGFGLPPLEAMKCGVPVIASHTSSFPEALGDAALLVNPHHVYEFAQAMEQLLSDKALRMHYIQKGFERVKRFTWEETARQTLNVLLA